jgi:AcrR family transcriptional regulator
MPRLKEETTRSIQETVEAVALELFVKQGYAATSTREIASAAGYTAGALYAHYASKQALFAKVVTRYRKRVADDMTLRDVLRRSQFPYDIPELAHAIKTLVRQNREHWLLWYIDILEFDGKHFKSQVAPKTLIHEAELSSRFTELRQQKLLRVEPELAFVMVYMQLFNYFLVEQIFGGRDHYGVPEAQAIDAMAEVFKHGVLAKGARA